MTRIGIALLGLVWLVAGDAGVASAQWSENGVAVADTAWRQTDGEFGAMLLVTDDLQSFLEQWSRPAAPGYRPNMSTTDRAARGETVAAVILFNHCAPAGAGSCHAVVDFTILRPDGTVYAEHAGAPLWNDAPPTKGHLQVGVAQLAFEVESDDPLGEYRIETRVRDMVSLRSVELVRSLRVVDADPPTPAKSSR